MKVLLTGLRLSVCVWLCFCCEKSVEPPLLHGGQ